MLFVNKAPRVFAPEGGAAAAPSEPPVFDQDKCIFLSHVFAMQTKDVLAVMAVGLLLSLLATLYPASRASKVNPVEAIHYG